MPQISLGLKSKLFYCFLFVFLVGCVPGGPVDIALANPKYSGIVVDAKTGRVLYAHKANARRYPASITKVMTLYLLFEALDRGKVSMSTKIKVSRRAARQPPSNVRLKPGSRILVRDAIRVLIVKSANDVAVAVGELLAGSEARFARLMTKKARQLGMRHTVFKSASGLHRAGQYTTAKDLAILGRAMRERFPKKYKYFSTRRITYHKRKYRNHNHLLGKVRGLDGIKTGYTRVSGFNILVSVRAGKRDIIVVVLGGKTSKRRNNQAKLLVSRYLKKASRGRYRSFVLKRTSKRRVAKSSMIGVKIAKLVAAGKMSLPSPLSRTLYLSSSHPRANGYPSAELAAINEISQLSRFKAGARGGQNSNLIGFAGKRPIPRTRFIPQGNTASKNRVLNLPVARRSVPNASVPSGNWVVQLGALPNEISAKQLLVKVKQRFNPLLKNALAFTETINKSNLTLVRARLGGFKSKNQARRVCAYLVKRQTPCLALKRE